LSIWTTYFEKGTLSWKLNYKNGYLEFSQDYCEKGNLKSRGYYTNLVPADLWESFDEESS
tara:strand:- start:923 stop:1102 length:180 start_codon:yes stop_codon:yes gene_type:complete